MSQFMAPARTQGSAGDVPDVENHPVESSQTFLKGTVLKLVSGEFQEVTVDSDNGSLYAVSLEGCESGETDGPSDDLAAARINDDTYFTCPVIDSSGPTVVTDLSTLTVGDQGDLEVDGDVYYFDTNSEASAALEIVAIFDDLDLVLVKFISSVIA